MIEIKDVDLKQLSELDIQQIGRDLLEHLVVVIRGQDLTPDDQSRICGIIGDMQNYHKETYVREYTKNVAVHENILRVTGEKDKEGKQGLFGHNEVLDWHANMVGNPMRDPLIWLYGVKGTKGSRTSWLDNAEAYKNLPESLKERIKKLKIYTGYEVNRISPTTYFHDHIGDIPFDMYYKNPLGKEGMFFPFLQIFAMEEDGEFIDDYQEVIDEIRSHVEREEYMYHHDWEDGDVVISEQWLSLHKRWHFDDMENRLLHRIAFGYNNIV